MEHTLNIAFFDHSSEFNVFFIKKFRVSYLYTGYGNRVSLNRCCGFTSNRSFYLPLKTFPKHPSPISFRNFKVSRLRIGTALLGHVEYCGFGAYRSAKRIFLLRMMGDGWNNTTVKIIKLLQTWNVKNKSLIGELSRCSYSLQPVER